MKMSKLCVCILCIEYIFRQQYKLPFKKGDSFFSKSKTLAFNDDVIQGVPLKSSVLCFLFCLHQHLATKTCRL